MKKLTVLVVVDHAIAKSGPHRNVVTSLNALVARKDVTVRLLTGQVDQAEAYMQSKNIDVQLGFEPHNIKAFFNNCRLILHAAKGCDIIYVPSGLKAFCYAQLVHLNKPVVASPNVTPISRKKDAPGWLELSWMCNAWIESSFFRYGFVTTDLDKDLRKKIHIVHHGMDTRLFTPANRNPDIWQTYGVPMSPLKVLYVGRDNQECKGVSQLIDAVDVINRNKNNYSFIFVGKMSKQTQERLAQYDNAYVLGFRTGSELASIYASTDLSVVPSSWESFGFTVLEAMASGLPVIGSAVGGIKEQIIDNESGILVDITYPDKVLHLPEAGDILANAILRLADDPTLRQCLGIGARKRALDHFSEERLGNDLHRLFNEVVSQ